MRAQESCQQCRTWLVALLVAASVVIGCKSSDETTPIVFTPGAMKTVPLIRPSTPSSLRASNALTVSQDFFVKQLFSMQCRHPDWGSVNYCPPGTPSPPSGVFDPYQFTMQTLIGFIFHAQGYSDLLTGCSSEKTVSPASYTAASSLPSANPTRFVMDQFSTYTCQVTSGFGGGQQYRAASAVSDGSYQTTLHTRYRYDTGSGPQTDFFQTDVSLSNGTPQLLAFNFAAATPFASRLILLADLVNHRFAMKYYVPAQPSNNGSSPERYAVAVGAGGWDLQTGTPNAGHYFITYLGEPAGVPGGGVVEGCANNATGDLQQSDFSGCTADGVPITWTSSDAIATYLGVPATAQARLAPYLAKFQTPATLTSGDSWKNQGDEDLYWPATLH